VSGLFSKKIKAAAKTKPKDMGRRRLSERKIGLRAYSCGGSLPKNSGWYGFL